MEKTVYLDNAATSFPKPESVYVAVDKAMREACGNPGRSGHKLSLSAGRIVDEARMLCARLFNAQSPETIIFTNNTTTALNIAIKGFLNSGDHVITSSLEHNSVSRPLNHMAPDGINVTKIPTDLFRGLGADDIAAAVQPNTKLVVCTHISNVTGTVNDIASIGSYCREKGIAFLVDAAQSAGVKPIDAQQMKIDMIAFPGHKGLFGPQGTGGLYIRPGLELGTIIQGGTGSVSESLRQPESSPEKYESGTLNTPGLAGLAAGIRFILETGIEQIDKRETHLVNRLIEGICAIDSVSIIGPDAIGQGAVGQGNIGQGNIGQCVIEQGIIGPGGAKSRGNVVSVRIESISVPDAAVIMDTAFNIAVRGGLHCASDAHRSAGTLETGGTIRISPNYFNSEADIDYCLAALESCAKGFV